MPALIPGFEYDVFISYRQKDNKYDGWVTDFVANLKRELEATFKEDVSVYFDENPHDGLLEIHNVNKSLEGKLRSLILIPIVSQTYCDTKSYAWQHEFCVFNKQAKEDAFGRDIKLLSGNVASRILPIRIHELDTEDKVLLETELGSTFRCIEFIYKSAGVNRPLKPDDDRTSNVNHTYYRDQINKTANGVKEIVQAMLAPERKSITSPVRGVQNTSTTPGKGKALRYGVIAFATIAIFLIGYLAFASWQREKKVKAIRNGSIAILPFENQTGRADLNSIGQVAADFITTKLIQNQFWKVIGAQDVFRQTVYSGVVTNPEAEKRMLNEAQLDFLVLGHYNLFGDSVFLVATVNDVTEKKVLYTTPIIKCLDSNPMKAVTEAEQYILGFLMFSSQKDKLTTRPPRYDAYQAYLRGMEIWTKYNMSPGTILEDAGTAVVNYFHNAISLDPDFLPPYFKLAEVFSHYRRFQRLDSVLRVLETKQKLFLDDDNLNYNTQKLIAAKEYDALEAFLLTKVDVGSSNFRPYYLLAVNSLYRQNKPKKALEYIANCDLEEFDFDNKATDQLLYAVQLAAYHKLKQFDKVIKVTDSFNFTVKQFDLKRNRWLALYFTHNNDQVYQELEAYLHTVKPNNGGVPTASISVFRAAQLRGDSVAMLQYYQQFKRFIQGWDEKQLAQTPLKFIDGVMMFRTKENLIEAEDLLKQNLPFIPMPRKIHMLGILYAATGREEKANEVIKTLLSFENEFDNGLIRYYVAKIEAELGHKEASVQYLRESVAKGMEFREELFEFDADLKNLLDYPPFIELVTPKE